MFFTTLMTLVIASFVRAQPVAAQQPSQLFQISTPGAVYQCEPVTFTWTPTVAPYYLTIHHADTDALFTPEEDPIIVRRNSMAWVIDYPAGTTVRVHVRDATGEVTATSPMYINEGFTDCMA